LLFTVFHILGEEKYFLPRLTPKQLDSLVQEESNVKIDDDEDCATCLSLCSQSNAKKSVLLLLGAFQMLRGVEHRAVS
jgi:hypothetical protein